MVVGVGDKDGAVGRYGGETVFGVVGVGVVVDSVCEEVAVGVVLKMIIDFQRGGLVRVQSDNEVYLVKRIWNTHLHIAKHAILAYVLIPNSVILVSVVHVRVQLVYSYEFGTEVVCIGFVVALGDAV